MDHHGWEIPAAFGSVDQEYRAIREGAALIGAEPHAAVFGEALVLEDPQPEALEPLDDRYVELPELDHVLDAFVDTHPDAFFSD